MMKIPSVGSKVSVTVRHKSVYLYSTSPWDERTYTGIVTKSPKWVDADSFSLQTDDVRFPVKIIHSGNVQSVKLLSGSVQNIRRFEVKSKSGVYTVSQSGKQYSCTCVGFKYHAKCKHITAVVNKLHSQNKG
jgi:hypothetical protein